VQLLHALHNFCIKHHQMIICLHEKVQLLTTLSFYWLHVECLHIMRRNKTHEANQSTFKVQSSTTAALPNASCIIHDDLTQTNYKLSQASRTSQIATGLRATVSKTVRPMLSGHSLSVCPDCNVGVLWPNSWMDQDETWYRGRPQPWPHCVR